MSRLQGKVVIAQGGGPTAVINQSLVGAVVESRKFPQITRVWGAVHGVRGIIDETFVDLSEATNHNLELVAQVLECLRTGEGGRWMEHEDLHSNRSVEDLIKEDNYELSLLTGAREKGEDQQETRMSSDHPHSARHRVSPGTTLT